MKRPRSACTWPTRTLERMQARPALQRALASEKLKPPVV
jgi:hypothetical protein